MSDKRSTVSEEVYIDLDYCDLEDCISHLREAFNKVPEDCRESARFYVEYGEEYGSCYVRQRIQYQRPETDKEMNKRLEQVRVWEEQRIANAKKVLGIK